VIRTLKLDTYGCISLVNFIRSSVAAPGADAAAVAKAVMGCDATAPQSWPWRDEAHLKPVLADDPLLYSLAMGMDDDDEGEEGEAGAAPSDGAGGAAAEAEHAREVMAEMRAMQAQMAEVLSGVFSDDDAAGPAAVGPRGAAASAAAAGPRYGDLAFTTYSFTSSRVCTNQLSSHSSCPPALSTLLQY